MCHNSGLTNAQIDHCVDQGMPQKIVRTVKYTLRKRAEEFKRIEESKAVAITEEMMVQGAKITNSLIENPSTATRNNNETRNPSSGMAAETTPSIFKIPKMCGRFRQMQQQQQQQHQPIADIGSAAAKELKTMPASTDMDALAVGTQWTRHLGQRLAAVMTRLQSSQLYTLLTKTTQPAHIIAICIISFVLLTVWPEIIYGPVATPGATGTHSKLSSVGGTVATQHEMNDGARNNGKHPLAIIAYLGAFATHFGAQIWMTFVSGLSLYFSLPRHTFGQCQQILFPKYFAMNATLSITMLILYVKYFVNVWTTPACIQLGALILCALIEVTVRLYLAPPMLLLMHEKYKIEGAIGSGREIGTSIVQGDLVQCPHYQRIHKAFRRIHMTVAIGNMLVLLSTCVHLYFIASKIQM